MFFVYESKAFFIYPINMNRPKAAPIIVNEPSVLPVNLKERHTAPIIAPKMAFSMFAVLSVI